MHTIKQEAKESFKIQHNDTMNIIAKAYINHRECSVREAFYHILPELRKLKRIFPAVPFVKLNLFKSF